MVKSAPIALTTRVRLSSRFRLQWEEAQQCFVLLFPEGMIQLNASAGEILKRCQQTTSVATVIDDLNQSFPDADNLAADVLAFFTEAEAEGWLDSGAG